MKRSNHYDIAIIGAGPAGSSAALNLIGSGLKIAVLDAATFPRNKVCGDGLSGSVLQTLRKFPDNIAEDFLNFEPKLKSTGIRFVSPSLCVLDLPLSISPDEEIINPGFTCKRIDFDNFLFQHLKRHDSIDIFENFKVEKILREDDRINIISNKKQISASILVGADGANSITAKHLTNNKADKKHHSLCVMSYYKNVSGLHPQNYIELHFLKEIIPGYFWIFPMKDNVFNVGLGTLSSDVVRKKINLKSLFNNLISDHPIISQRFYSTEKLTDLVGKGIPLGSQKREISGDRFILCGDAAGLVNPLTSEGISYAMRSGLIASQHIKRCFKKNDFSADFMRAYNNDISKKFSKEFRINHTIQKLSRHPWLFNFVVKKANRNKDLKELFIRMYTDMAARSLLIKPSFYVSLLLK